MKTKNLIVRSVILICAAVVPLFSFDACSFCVSTGTFMCELMKKTDPKEATDSVIVNVINSQDTLAVYQGSACGKSSKSGTEDIVILEGSLDLPQYATNGAVFLNGWKVEFLDPDHHLGGLGVLIRNIRLEDNPVLKTRTLKWEASGGISDKNFDDSYTMCYHYTVVAWNETTVSLAIDQDDGDCFTPDLNSNLFAAGNENTTTALSTFQTFLFNPAFIQSEKIAILPRGFGVGWTGCDVDHHLLEFGYNMDHSDLFIKNSEYKKGGSIFNPSFPDNANRIDSGFVSWQSSVVFKDNDARRGYSFGEMASGLGGADVSLIDPPFKLLPKEDDCDGGVGQQQPEEIVVKNIKYRYAIPMLTGWDIGYTCNDEHVKTIGVWIENWNYTVDPLLQSGTLNYKINSSLSDQDADNSFYRTQKVSILGIKTLLPTKIGSESKIDLVPVIPPGSPVNSFCRRDPQGNMLFVTIKNQGTADAGMTATTVEFGGQKVNINTPPIKAGESVDLQFTIPGNCYDPECDFTIIADSQKQIDEGSNEMNNSVKAVCQRVIL